MSNDIIAKARAAKAQSLFDATAERFVGEVRSLESVWARYGETLPILIRSNGGAPIMTLGTVIAGDYVNSVIVRVLGIGDLDITHDTSASAMLFGRELNTHDGEGSFGGTVLESVLNGEMKGRKAALKCEKCGQYIRMGVNGKFPYECLRSTCRVVGGSTPRTPKASKVTVTQVTEPKAVLDARAKVAEITDYIDFVEGEDRTALEAMLAEAKGVIEAYEASQKVPA